MENVIVINGEEYVKKSTIKESLRTVEENGMEYVLIRTYSAGVHVGFLEKREGKEVTLKNSRRIWYWEGAASLSQLALEGVSKPENCKFSVVVPKILLTESIEVINVTDKAKTIIEGVPEWKK